MHNSFPNNFGAGPFRDFLTGSWIGGGPLSGGGLGVVASPLLLTPFDVRLLFEPFGIVLVLIWFGFDNKNVGSPVKRST